jgi:hypothetical protein
MTYTTQEDRERIAANQFSGTHGGDFDRRLIGARGLVQEMQGAGILPERMSDNRFSAIALWIAAGMKAAVEDGLTEGSVTVQIPPVYTWGCSTHGYAIDGYEIGSRNVRRLATISRAGATK